MTPDNQADTGKSRRGPGRRPSRTGWRPLLFRVSRYFKDSTGGAAGKGLAEEGFKTVSPVVSPEGVLQLTGKQHTARWRKKSPKRHFYSCF